MKILKRLFPVLLVLLIVSVGILSGFAAHQCMPGYKNMVLQHSANNHSNMLFIADDEKLLIYPWDLYDENKVKSYKSTMEAELGEKGSSLAKNTNQAFIDMVRALFPETVPRGDTDFYSKLVYDENEYFYLKDASFLTEKGDRYLLNLAYTTSMLLYIHCVPDGQRDAVQAEFDEVEKTFSIRAYDGKFERFLLTADSLASGQNILLEAMKSDNYYSFSLDNEMLFVFTGQSVYNIILMYNAVTKSISGFSLKMENMMKTRASQVGTKPSK